IPLALELAAAWVRVLSAEQIAARLVDGFHLLAGDTQPPPAGARLSRQRTLRAAIQWSYSLLTSEERTLLCRLSVFVGGWGLDAGGGGGPRGAGGQAGALGAIGRGQGRGFPPADCRPPRGHPTAA